CKICGIRKSSSICQFVCNVSSLYQGAKKATDSPQPTVPWSSIASKSKKSLFSIVPKLVVNGAFNFIFIRRMTISLMFIFCSSSFVTLESFISSLRIVSIMNRCTTTDFQTFFFHKIIGALCFILVYFHNRITCLKQVLKVIPDSKPPIHRESRILFLYLLEIVRDAYGISCSFPYFYIPIFIDRKCSRFLYTTIQSNDSCARKRNCFFYIR